MRDWARSPSCEWAIYIFVDPSAWVATLPWTDEDESRRQIAEVEGWPPGFPKGFDSPRSPVIDTCENCHGDGGILLNDDWPMGDCGDRVWIPCTQCDSPSRKAEVWRKHRLQYGHDRFGSPLN